MRKSDVKFTSGEVNNALMNLEDALWDFYQSDFTCEVVSDDMDYHAEQLITALTNGDYHIDAGQDVEKAVLEAKQLFRDAYYEFGKDKYDTFSDGLN